MGVSRKNDHWATPVSIEPSVVDHVVSRVREACGVPVEVTTGQWIEPDLDRRLHLVSRWRSPDFTSVNVSEPGSFELMRTLIGIGVGIEAGVWTPEDAVRLGASGLGRQVTRILVEPGMLQVGSSTEAALQIVDDIHGILDEFGLTVPRLQHGDGDVTWTLSKTRFVGAFTRTWDSRTRCMARMASEPAGTRRWCGRRANWGLGVERDDQRHVFYPALGALTFRVHHRRRAPIVGESEGDLCGATQATRRYRSHASARARGG